MSEPLARVPSVLVANQSVKVSNSTATNFSAIWTYTPTPKGDTKPPDSQGEGVEDEDTSASEGSDQEIGARRRLLATTESSSSALSFTIYDLEDLAGNRAENVSTTSDGTSVFFASASKFFFNACFCYS